MDVHVVFLFFRISVLALPGGGVERVMSSAGKVKAKTSRYDASRRDASACRFPLSLFFHFLGI